MVENVGKPVFLSIELPGWKHTYSGVIESVYDDEYNSYVVFRHTTGAIVKIPLGVIKQINPRKEEENMLRNEMLEYGKENPVTLELRHGFKNEGRVTGTVTYYGDGEVYFRAEEANNGIIVLDLDHIETIEPNTSHLPTL